MSNGIPIIFLVFIFFYYFNVTLIYLEDQDAHGNQINNRRIRKTYWILALKSSYVPTIIETIISIFVLNILIIHLGYIYYFVSLLCIWSIAAGVSVSIYDYNYLEVNRIKGR